MVPGLKGMTYDERLNKLGIIRLVERRFRGDMIETHKIMSGREGVKREDFFQAAVEMGDPNLVRGKKKIQDSLCISIWLSGKLFGIHLSLSRLSYQHYYLTSKPIY